MSSVAWVVLGFVAGALTAGYAVGLGAAAKRGGLMAENARLRRRLQRSPETALTHTYQTDSEIVH